MVIRNNAQKLRAAHGPIYYGEQGSAMLAKAKLLATTTRVDIAAPLIEHAMDRFAFGNSNPGGYGTINAPGVGKVALSRDYPMTTVKGRVVEVEFEATTKAHKNVDPEVSRKKAEVAMLDWLKGEFNKTDRDPRGFGAVVSVRVAVKLDGET